MNKRCDNCDKYVQPIKSNFSIAWFVLWIVFTGGFGLFIYPLYHVMKTKSRCPICGLKIC